MRADSVVNASFTGPWINREICLPVYFLWSAMSNCEALFIDTSISKYKFETANIVQDQINYVDTLKVLQ